MPGLFDRLQGELDGQQKAAGLTMADVLELPEPLRRLVNWMMRETEVTLTQVAEFTSQSEDDTRRTLAGLIEKGFVREIPVKPVPRYRVRLGRKRGQDIPLNLWDKLGEKTE